MKETGAGHAERDDCLRTRAETVSTPQQGGLPPLAWLGFGPQTGRK